MFYISKDYISHRVLLSLTKFMHSVFVIVNIQVAYVSWYTFLGRGTDIALLLGSKGIAIIKKFLYISSVFHKLSYIHLIDEMKESEAYFIHFPANKWSNGVDATFYFVQSCFSFSKIRSFLSDMSSTMYQRNVTIT